MWRVATSPLHFADKLTPRFTLRSLSPALSLRACIVSEAAACWSAIRLAQQLVVERRNRVYQHP